MKTALDDLHDEALALIRQVEAVKAGKDFGKLLRKRMQVLREQAENGEEEV